MKRPFIPIFLFALCLLALTHTANPYYEILAPFQLPLFIAALSCFAFKKFHISYLFIGLAIALALAVQFQKLKHNYLQEVETPIPTDRYVVITGRLTDFPGIRDDHTPLEVAVETIETAGQTIQRRFNARVHVKGILRHLNRGDRLRIDCILHPLRFNESFERNPIRNYYLYRGIHRRGYSKSRSFVTVEEPAPLHWRLVGAWRQAIAQSLEERYTTDQGTMTPEGVFLSAVLLGDRGRMGNMLKDKLLRSGIFHIFSISGAHIGIIALFCLWFLKLLKIPMRGRTIATAVVLLLFLALSGFKVSAQRAVMMALFIFWARVVYDDYDIYNIIAAAGMLILIMNPAEFLDAGFVLSFGLTAAIVLGRRLILERWQTAPRYPLELVSANLSASLAAFPISLFYFQRYSFAGIITSLLLLPLTAVILGFSILLIPIAPFWNFAAQGLLAIIDPFLKLFFVIVDLSRNLWFLEVYRSAPSFFLVAGTLILYGLVTSGKQLGKRRLVFIVLFAGIFLFLIIGSGPYKSENLEVYFLDVGQGDCACVVFPNGDALLVDGGGAIGGKFQVGSEIVLPFLLSKRIRVRWILVSHFHPDHVNGISEIISAIKPEELWISSSLMEDACYNNLLKQRPEGCRIRTVAAGFSRETADCRMRVIYPPQVIEGYFSKNNHSTVLKVEDRYHGFLFSGDIEGEAEGWLVRRNCRDIEAHVLKIPHHGSRTSSSLDFLNCVNPEISILSTASGNRFGFPHRRVIDNHKKLLIPILSTAKRGGIRIVSTQSGLRVETTR